MSKKMITNRLVEDCPYALAGKEHFRRMETKRRPFRCPISAWAGETTTGTRGVTSSRGTALMNWYRSSIGSRATSSQSSRMVEATPCSATSKESGIPGPIVAFGDVLRDQLMHMERCGFSSLVLREDQDPKGPGGLHSLSGVLSI